MRKLTFILILLIVSCKDEKTVKQDDRLVYWKSDFIMEDGEQVDGFFKDHENFIKPYFSTKYKNDTLTVTTLMRINCCGNTIADIRTSNDTLYLLTRQISNEACACVDYYKFTYIIHNPGNREFIIQSEN